MTEPKTEGAGNKPATAPKPATPTQPKQDVDTGDRKAGSVKPAVDR